MENGLSQSSKKSVRVITSESVQILSRKDSLKGVSMKSFLRDVDNGKATTNMI